MYFLLIVSANVDRQNKFIGLNIEKPNLCLCSPRKVIYKKCFTTVRIKNYFLLVFLKQKYYFCILVNYTKLFFTRNSVAIHRS